MPVEQLSVSINLPFVGSIGGTWTPNEASKNAAWKMFVQLSTRITTVEFQDGMSPREAMDSIYKVIDKTREILEEGGPAVAQPPHKRELSFGSIAIDVVNKAIRPMLSKWHGVLERYEADRPADVKPRDWEERWEDRFDFAQDLSHLQRTLVAYANTMARANDIEMAIDDVPVYVRPAPTVRPRRAISDGGMGLGSGGMSLGLGGM